jgi:hypothetical protein
MGAIQDIFRDFGPAYRERFGKSIPREHLKVIEAICACRSEAFGSVCYRCEDCGHPHLVPAACGNRHCPQCQHHKARLWLERQLERQLPGPHFMLTFTVPESLRAFLRAHQRAGYSALFEASSQAIKTLIADPRFVGADQAGFFGVLHTWGRQLQYHPHIHYLVPGGALSSADSTWHPSSPGFLLPVKALSKLFRAKFRASLRALGLEQAVPAETWTLGWNVNSQAVPNAEASIRYLAPYVFKVAISDARIVQVADGRVSFSYRKVGSSRPRTLTLDAFEFLRRFLQHVLPTGFMKVRYYGLLSPSAKLPLPALRARVELAHAFTVTVPDIELPPWPETPCQACGGKLRFHKSLRIHRSAKAAARGVGPPSPALTQPSCH